MLSRVLEPEVMDSSSEASDYDSMDHSEVNRLFVAELLAARERDYDPSAKPPSHEQQVAPPEFGDDDWEEDRTFDVLDLGTGTAQIPIELCQAWEQHERQSEEASTESESTQSESAPRETLRVIAVDMAVHMLELARMNLEIAGLTQQVQLEQVDAKEMPFEDQMFDCVMSNSIVHHIPNPATVLSEAVRVCRPGGLLFLRDLLRPDSDDEVTQLVKTYAVEANDHQRQMFDDSLRAALSLDEIRDLVSELGFDPQSVQQTTDRHWTWAGTKKVE